jgi:hypothetical protein
MREGEPQAIGSTLKRARPRCGAPFSLVKALEP